MTNKKDLIRAVSEITGFTHAVSDRTISALTEVIFNELSKGSEVNVSNLGKFKLSRREARRGFNPSTQERINIGEMNVPKFNSCIRLKKAVKFIGLKKN